MFNLVVVITIVIDITILITIAIAVNNTPDTHIKHILTIPENGGQTWGRKELITSAQQTDMNCVQDPPQHTGPHRNT